LFTKKHRRAAPTGKELCKIATGMGFFRLAIVYVAFVNETDRQSDKVD
jgi:hypothetical protein